MPLKVNRVNSMHKNTVVEVPQWLSASLLRDLLNESVNQFENIVKFTTKTWSAQPDVQSLQINIEVHLRNGQLKKLCFLLKTLKSVPNTKTAQSTVTRFRKEYTVYCTLLPAFEALYKAANKEIKFATFSRSLRALDDVFNANYILLDDLQLKGYRRGNRVEGLDVSHMQFALAKLAAYHAASAVYGRFSTLFRGSKVSEAVLSNAQRERNELLNRKFVEGLRWYGLRQFQDSIKSYQKSLESLPATDGFEVGEFQVLQHGSCWLDNILFLEDAFGHVRDVVFADFGGGQLGTPAKDLLHLLLTAPRLADKLKNFDYYVKCYHDALIANLQLLKYGKSLPKLTDLHLSMLKCSGQAYEVIAKILPFALLEATKHDIDIADILDGDKPLDVELVNEAFSNPRYAAEIQMLLPWLENRAFLEE